MFNDGKNVAPPVLQSGMIKKFFTICLYQLLLETSIGATGEPTISSIQLGKDQGRQVQCEGRLSLVQESLNPAIECRGELKNNMTCVHLSVEWCQIWKDIKAVRCNAVRLDKAMVEKMKAMPLVNDPGDIDILQELEKRGIKMGAPSYWVSYHQLVKKKISRKPKVNVKGRLSQCTECSECGPLKVCELADCKVDLIY